MKFYNTKLRLIFLFSFCALLAGFTAVPIETEAVKHFLSEAMQNELTKTMLIFGLASWIHSSRVRKEIRENFTSLTSAINDVADAFKKDLEEQRKVTDNLISRVQTLEDKSQVTIINNN